MVSLSIMNFYFHSGSGGEGDEGRKRVDSHMPLCYTISLLKLKLKFNHQFNNTEG